MKYTMIAIVNGDTILHRNYNTRVEANNKVFSLIDKYDLQLDCIIARTKHDVEFRCENYKNMFFVTRAKRR